MNNYKNWMMVFSGALTAGLMAPGTLSAQEAEQKSVPLFDINPIYKDGATHLVRADGSGLTLIRMGEDAFLKFDDDEEVWALSINRGAANTEIFKSDVDKVMLRLSDRGNLSLYTPHYPGEPLGAIQANDIKAFKPVRHSKDFEERLRSYASLRLGTILALELDHSAGAGRLEWLEDAAIIVVKGMVKAKEQSGDIRRLRITTGRFEELNLSDDGTFTVVINPARGYKGRPSSDKVTQFLRARFTS